MVRFRPMTYRYTRTAKLPVLFIAFAVLGVCTVENLEGQSSIKRANYCRE